MIAGSGVNRTVDIVWSSGGMELERMNDVLSTPMNNLVVYTHFYTISQLRTTDDERVIGCDATINETVSIVITRNITLEVTGEYYSIVQILTRENSDELALRNTYLMNETIDETVAGTTLAIASRKE